VLLCEAVSAKSNPHLEALLATTGDAALRQLGFDPPGVSPSYSQRIKVDGPEDLAYAVAKRGRAYMQPGAVFSFILVILIQGMVIVSLRWLGGHRAATIPLVAHCASFDFRHF
jgi:hypothetical protein